MEVHLSDFFRGQADGTTPSRLHECIEIVMYVYRSLSPGQREVLYLNHDPSPLERGAAVGSGG